MSVKYEDLTGKVSKTTEIIVKVAAVIGAITVISGAYSFYLNNIWKPKIKVSEVNFDLGTAEIEFKGNKIRLNGDDVRYLKGDWGVKMGSNSGGYSNIALIKNGMVIEHIINK